MIQNRPGGLAGLWNLSRYLAMAFPARSEHASVPSGDAMNGSSREFAEPPVRGCHHAFGAAEDQISQMASF